VAIIKNGKLLVFDTMEALRASLGKREYQIIFRADETLDYARRDGNYVYHTHELDAIATLLETISARKWTLINLSVQESALEEIYVKLMTR
jgi:ABC-2 type transport system ATP-binding protein